eukprot:Skav232680  [mRNA]  locus=scaffold698:409902:412556:+ [translate_table: standard]
MEAAEVAFWVCTLLVQASSILWLLVSLKVFLDSGDKTESGTCGRRLLLLRRSLKRWWHALLGRPLDQRTSEELDLMRCRLTKRFWALAIPVGISRLASTQLRMAVFDTKALAGIDIAAIMIATFGLTLQFKPGLMNPKSLDAWYVVTSLALNLTIISSQLNARDLLALVGGPQLLLALLAKRTWCCILCTSVSSAQVFRIASVQGTRFLVKEANGSQRLHFFDSAPQAEILMIFVLPLLVVCAVRRILHENAVLQMDLQKRTVELGALSSLLLVCYDAVFPADETLKLMEDSPQLSGLLLHTAGGKGLAGKSLLEFCSEDDHDRISTHFFNSVTEGAPVMALHVDMLDSDQNHLQVELVHARFTSSDRRCFLIGVREIQDMDAGPAPLERNNFPIVSQEPHGQTHHVTFDASSFEVLTMSPQLEQVCEQMALPKVDSILELSNISSRDCFNHRLQGLLNQVIHAPKDKGAEYELKFDLLGLCNVTSFIHVEYDAILDAVVATMRLHLVVKLPCATSSSHGDMLTEDNVQKLESRPRSLKAAWTSVATVARTAGPSSHRSAAAKPITQL